MISKNTYDVIKLIPQYPNTITLLDLQYATTGNLNVSLLANILEDAMNCNYIIPKGRNVNSDITNMKFYISDSGQVALEEYENRQSSSTKSTWAIIIAGLSLLTSIISIIISCVK